MTTLPVTVIIPTYNRRPMLLRAVAGVTAQTARPAQVVVVDDCSEDESAEAARAAGCDVVRHDVNRGAAAARNSGFAAATQPWVALLDSDDEWRPEHLATLWAQRGEHVIVAATALRIGRDGAPVRVLGPPLWRDVTIDGPDRLIYPENLIAASGVLVRRDVVERVGGYDTTLRYAEDYDLWSRVLEHGTARCLAAATVLVREHGAQKSRDRGGPGAAQRRIATRAATDAAGRRRVERRIGVRAWDDLRRAQAEEDPAGRRRALRILLAGNQRLVGVLGIFVWRALIRRRGRSLTAEGTGRVARWHAPPGPGPEEDWSGLDTGEVARRLLLAPPRRIRTTGALRRLAARAAGAQAG